MNHVLTIGGVFRWKHWSRFYSWGPGAPRRYIIDEGTCHNGICTPGLNDLLSATFEAGTQRTAWYAGLINLSGFTALSAADTMASHAGWTELTSYVASTRPQWTPAAPSAGVIVNPTLFSYNFTAPGTAHGLFIASTSNKGGTTGILWSTAEFDVDQAMSAGELLSADYELTAAAGAGS